MNIILKRPKTKIERQMYNYKYYIYVSNVEVGYIIMKRYSGYMLIGDIKIYEEYRRKEYAYSTLCYIFNHYNIKGIVGEIIDSTSAKNFWNYSIKQFTGCKVNNHKYSNTIGSFIIPKQDIESHLIDDMLSVAYSIG